MASKTKSCAVLLVMDLPCFSILSSDLSGPVFCCNSYMVRTKEKVHLQNNTRENVLSLKSDVGKEDGIRHSAFFCCEIQQTQDLHYILLPCDYLKISVFYCCFLMRIFKFKCIL